MKQAVVSLFLLCCIVLQECRCRNYLVQGHQLAKYSSLMQALVSPLVEELSTPGGERALVHQKQAPRRSTVVLLEEEGITQMEVELTTCVCQRNESTVTGYRTHLECKVMPTSQGRSIGV